ncbi:MAG: DnaD domain protein, partial [Clostridia bacterium]|nr:DnaD domain protein [Clostridia bacterium]
FSMDMIGYAYEETIRNTGKYTYTYIDKILAKWHEAGYQTPEQAAAAPKGENKPTRRTTRKPAANNPRKSAAANDAMDLAWKIVQGDEEA